jgi:hypothetical protein
VALSGRYWARSRFLPSFTRLPILTSVNEIRAGQGQLAWFWGGLRVRGILSPDSVVLIKQLGCFFQHIIRELASVESFKEQLRHVWALPSLYAGGLLDVSYRRFDAKRDCLSRRRFGGGHGRRSARILCGGARDQKALLGC